MTCWQLSGAVILRPEAFGGMAFHRERGITLEMDKEAYCLVRSYVTPQPLPADDLSGAHVLPQLVRMGFLHPAATMSQRADIDKKPGWLGNITTLSVPETVHIALTTRCNLACPGCYVSHQSVEQELTVAEWCELIQQWARMHVFQMAVGGGEPLLYDGVFKVLTCARKHGLVPNVTTNGTLLDRSTIRALEDAGVARVNMSWRSSGGDQQEQDVGVLQTLRLLLDSRLQVGVNLLITPALLPHLSQSLGRLLAVGIHRVTLLRPKPPAMLKGQDMGWYDVNRLCYSDLFRLRAVLKEWHRVMSLEADSALVGLVADASPAVLRHRGIYGCVAGRRICTVWPDGRVTPCSFLGDLNAGSVRQTPFVELWRQGQSWEPLRSPTAQPKGSCTGCAAALQCGGARCIARYDCGDNSVPIAEALSAGDRECIHRREAIPCGS